MACALASVSLNAIVSEAANMEYWNIGPGEVAFVIIVGVISKIGHEKAKKIDSSKWTAAQIYRIFCSMWRLQKK